MIKNLKMSKNTKTYFTAKEVAVHNQPNNIWVTVFERVYDLTSLVKEYSIFKSDLIKPILMFAGKDVRHWFDKETEEFLHYTDVVTGQRLPFAPHGLVPHVAADAQGPGEIVWWRDPERQVGHLTRRVRPVRVINTLTGLTTVLETCCEDSCERIAERYAALGFSLADGAYTWRAAVTGLELEPGSTLEQNGMPDESQRFMDAGLPCDFLTPALLLYYNGVTTQPF